MIAIVTIIWNSRTGGQSGAGPLRLSSIFNF